MPQSGDALYCQVLANRGPEIGQSTRVDRDAPPLGLACPQPRRVQDVTYTVGGHHAFISIGREPLTSLSQRPLRGNYGVLYQINLTLENPTEQEVRTEIAFSADGGVARGVVVIDGQIRETGLVLASAEERLQEVTLPPHAKRRLRLQIMPQSGSNYPLRLVARPYG
jgi:hypothetical protein